MSRRFPPPWREPKCGPKSSKEQSWSASLPRLVIVSNRVSVPDAAGKGTAGGVAVALREAFQNYQGLWFGWSGKVATLFCQNQINDFIFLHTQLSRLPSLHQAPPPPPR